MYELVQFNYVFVQPFSWSLGSFVLVFPGRRLSITFKIKIDLKIKHLQKPFPKYIQNPLKHARWRFLRKQLPAFSFKLFSQNALSKMFGKILNLPLQPARTCGKISILNLPLQPLMIFTKRLILDVASSAYVFANCTTNASDVYQLELLAICLLKFA